MAVGNRHELVIELVEEVPGLLETLIERSTGLEVPEHDTIVEGGESANIRVPIELRADSVRVFRRGNTPQLAAVIEMQHREERKKSFDWPCFLFNARAEHQCPTILLVITVSARTAKWARRTIDGGLGQSLMRPVVICLDELEPGDDLGLRLLTAFADSASDENLKHLSGSLAELPVDRAEQYAGILLTGLQGSAYETWSELMKSSEYMYQNAYAQELLEKGLEKGLRKGRAEGKARMILRMLANRGVEVPDRVRDKILSCTDEAQLEHWFDQVLVTDDVERLFSE